jgi:hypothetical protein
MELLRSICLLISRGALISMVVILFVLPCLLAVLDPLIAHTTWHWLGRPSTDQSAAHPHRRLHRKAA